MFKAIVLCELYNLSDDQGIGSRGQRLRGSPEFPQGSRSLSSAAKGKQAPAPAGRTLHAQIGAIRLKNPFRRPFTGRHHSGYEGVP
jgi:hypothetical protein